MSTENMLAEIRADIKLLISEQSAIKARIPDGGFPCPVHAAQIATFKERIDGHEKDIRRLWKYSFTAYGFILAIYVLVNVVPPVYGMFKHETPTKPAAVLVVPSTNHFVQK